MIYINGQPDVEQFSSDGGQSTIFDLVVCRKAQDGSGTVYAAPGATAGGAPAVPTDPNLARFTTVLNFDGEDASTTCTDDTGNFTFATNGNAQLSATETKFGPTSAKFGGTGSYFDTPAVSGDNNFNFLTRDSETWDLACWAFFSTTSGNDAICSCSNDSQEGWSLARAGSGISFQARSVGVTRLSLFSTAFTLNAWNHIMIHRIQTTAYLYINGIRRDAKSYTPSTVPNGTDFFVGFSKPYNYSSNAYVDSLALIPEDIYGIGFGSTPFTVPTEPYPALPA